MNLVGAWMTFLSVFAAMMATGSATSADTLAGIEADLDGQCREEQFSGYVLAVEGEERVVDFGCAPERLEQPTDTSLFKLFSTSKIFAAAVILSLAEDGLLALDDPVAIHVTPFPDAWRSVTVQHLLQHNSGIPDLTLDLLAEFTDRNALNHAAAMQSLFARLSQDDGVATADPGGDFAYNNFGYEILVELARQVTGERFPDSLQVRVLDPAGMDLARLDLPLVENGEVTGSRPVAELIQGYNGAPGRLEPALSYSFVQMGAGALFASARDLEAYGRALAAGRVLSPAMQQRSISEALPVNAAVSYGFGEMIRVSNGCTVLQHSGGNNGFSIDFARVPERNITVAVLSNFGFAGAHRSRVAIVDALTAEEPCQEAG